MNEAGRWTGSFILVAAAHVGAVAATLGFQAEIETPRALPPASVMLELAPLPAAPETMAVDAPPGPDLADVVPEPEPPPPLEKLPTMAAATERAPEPRPRAERKPPAPPKPAERKPEKKHPARTAAPQVTQPAASAAAPLADFYPQPQSAALPSWKGTLLRHLERHKRYPAEARRARQEGITYVYFVMSRDGRVLAMRIERPAGAPSLDREGLELLQRAQPLPALPADQPGETLALVVPIRFTLRH